MKKVLFLFFSGVMLFGDTNTTVKGADKNESTPKVVKSKETKKKDQNLTKEQILKEQLKRQMELEEKYAKEQRFYQGKDYNLKEKEVDEKVLEHTPTIEPDYDFDITDVYADEQ